MNLVSIRPLAYLEYLLIRLLDSMYGLVPDQKAYAWGFAVAVKVYPLFTNRRRVAVDNIIRAGITEDKVNADRIARHAFGHLAGHICEALKIGNVVNEKNWREHIVFDGPEDSWQLLLNSPDVPILILTGHHGVWEAAASIISFSRPMIAVARKMNNPFVDRFLKQKHFRGDITIVPKKMGFSSGVLKDWRARGAAMTLLMDQHAGPRHGIKVDFMGHPAYTHTSPARLHLMSGAPILVGSFIRESAFKYRMVTGSPLSFTPTGDKCDDTLSLLTEINARLSAVIRRFPEQYLWAHKRWK
ncbi:MAG: lysophospholipid acyltransferase family protein [Kiritimatiellae bacterium]|nr:lysophospholipid acyltransferase family protein [Kiritimatiellia bacterium]